MVLRQKSLTLITIITILITTTSIATIARAQNSSSCKLTCGSGKSAKSVQYPFGFSEGCVIPLNCSDKNEIKLGEFTVQNVTRSSIFVHLPAQCNRRYQSIAPLFGPNFGPSWNNSLLFQNCTSPLPGCQIPAEFVQKRFNLSSCDNITCVSQAPNGSDIMRFEDLNRTRCNYLFGSFSVQSGRDSLLSLEFETLQLGWWVYTGLCECHLNATSTTVKLGEGKPLGCRCSCNAGFDGDGFKLGSGCQPVSQPEDRSKGDNEGFWFHVSMVFGFIVGFWAVCGTLVLKKSWRYAYFNFFDNMQEKVALKIALNVARWQGRL
ncbi:wall-associated receptor kinase-like 14 [Prunus avium]|uniref:Wall-associated receptor kinase-like 14 n=1 Tax=Prunus avium TaxID=42229 RepID=A0A6P5REI9_PRUAV|nr:wall-associated receptor kinase-like 14 [Prunus avium]